MGLSLHGPLFFRHKSAQRALTQSHATTDNAEVLVTNFFDGPIQVTINSQSLSEPLQSLQSGLGISTLPAP